MFFILPKAKTVKNNPEAEINSLEISQRRRVKRMQARRRTKAIYPSAARYAHDEIFVGLFGEIQALAKANFQTER